MGGVGRLGEYHAKRDPARTPEPMPRRGARRGARGRGEPVFVVQEHRATALHWDFRLERDGVLVSWALPRGVPADSRRDHRAVHTEDHPMEYADFEGRIPAGSTAPAPSARTTAGPTTWSSGRTTRSRSTSTASA